VHIDLHKLLINGLLGLFAAFIIVYTIVRSEERRLMVFRWVFSALVVWIMVNVTPMLALIVMLALIPVWRRPLASLISAPFESLYMGGGIEPEKKPLYSVAQSRAKMGRYPEAIIEIRQQLEKFPNDFEGQMMLAAVQAEHLNDVQGAELTIRRLVEQKGHAPGNVAFALSSLADWHLKYGQDIDSARLALERIIELLPNSEFSIGAAHRIAHLGTTEHLLAGHDRKFFAVPKGVHNLGLQEKQDSFVPAETDQTKVAQAYVDHLQNHPLDMDAREQLAHIYVDHYGRIDLAEEQLEQMITMPNQSPKMFARWLNLLADLQVRGGRPYEDVRATLERIVDQSPDRAAAEVARNRIARLKLEFKSRENPTSVKMGTYEQNIGLKGNLPKPPSERSVDDSSS
jgi:tetratricopeptide (TPR) repeat protein